MMPDFELNLDRTATGGAAIGTGPDGRIVFVTGGLPGERVAVEVVKEHRSRIEARAVSILSPSPRRRPEPCPQVARGCGGCDWQHVDEQGQAEQRRAIVHDCLRRIGGFDEVAVQAGPALPASGYRTTVRAAVVDGRAGFRAARSHQVIVADRCPVAHPLAEEILTEGRFRAAAEVTVRVGARTGERLVIVDPTAEGVVVPDGVVVVGVDELNQGRDVTIHEQIGEHRLRISARSFFQCRPDGAEALVALAGDAIAGFDGPLLDAYCGVGLFGVLLGAGRAVTGIESSRSSVADAEWNYRDDDQVVRASVERWRPSPFGAVIADPARSGLRRPAAERLVATGAGVLVLISCDPASLGRDAKILNELGYALDRVTAVDLFGETSHVEAVSRFVRR